ncbi:MAG TPA: DEAD/DEAH box helicase [Candidatus Thalassarchaeaceae archaeon]|nr:DEAD/DEAH box helicase [Candidatus Thalassarchaeaceae archaeon]
MVRFSDLGIGSDLVQSLADEGIEEPFEVQIAAIPSAMEGRDICCRAPTGSGKTLAFGLPLIERTPRANSKRPTALILTPTRELAEQIRNVLGPLASNYGMGVLSVYGGTSYGKQRKGLDAGVEILVACPGRLLDLMDRRALTLEDVEIVVLDEADRMADMGFMEPVCEIIESCSSKPQMILFSATLDDDVSKLVDQYQDNPEMIGIGPEEISMESMEHLFWKIKPYMKTEVSVKSVNRAGRSIIFCRTRRGVDRLGDEMMEMGVELSTLHGGLNQRQRDRAMSSFSSGRSMVLIATDVAARGIDVEGINCVIHYDPPDDAKVYKHRSGRTARAGSTGVVISLVKGNEKRRYDRIQREVGIKKRFSDPHPNDLEKKEFKLVEPRSKRVKNKPRQKSQRGDRRRSRGDNREDSQRGNQEDSGRRDHSKKGRRKKRFSNADGSPRNWGEQKKGRGSREQSRRNNQRGNNRNRRNNRNRSGRSER